MFLSDRDLAIALTNAKQLELQTRAAMQTEDLAEKDQATNAMRLVTALRQKLETWVSVRTLRAQISEPAGKF